MCITPFLEMNYSSVKFESSETEKYVIIDFIKILSFVSHTDTQKFRLYFDHSFLWNRFSDILNWKVSLRNPISKNEKLIIGYIVFSVDYKTSQVHIIPNALSGHHINISIEDAEELFDTLLFHLSNEYIKISPILPNTPSTEFPPENLIKPNNQAKEDDFDSDDTEDLMDEMN